MEFRHLFFPPTKSEIVTDVPTFTGNYSIFDVFFLSCDYPIFRDDLMIGNDDCLKEMGTNASGSHVLSNLCTLVITCWVLTDLFYMGEALYLQSCLE